ncbi:MAG TPA: acetate--CoA ligase family protein [Stellaceae bacterium]|nr:acetate--CoA ligase family protein [Stellaceae bacterium]
MPRPSLAEALFRPRGVALIGVSDDAGKTAGRPLRFLRKHGYAGPIYPINPNRSSVQGERAYASLADVPGPVDHAYILVNTPAVEAAVAACAQAGVAVASILASGFAEAGAEGREHQRKIVEVARSGGLRLVGPNCLGVVDTNAPLALTANAAFAADSLPRGRLTVLSQSGSLIGTLVSRGAVRGIHFGKLISVGNEADLSVGEIGAALADDPETDAFLLFLETIRAREEMARFAALAHRAGRPIIAYKLGRSEVGQALAVSHTGAMVGSDAAVDAFLRHHGIMRVDHFETLLEITPLIVSRKPLTSRKPRVGVIATTGGGAATVVDRLGMLGVDVAPASEATLAKLRAVGVPPQSGPIIDVTLAGTRYEVLRPALDIMMETAEFALVFATIGSSAQFQPELAVKPIIDCAREKKPIVVFITAQADEALRLLATHGIAAFRTPEACADAIAAYLAWREPAAPPSIETERLARAAALLRATATDVLNERQSLALFEALGVPVAPSLMLDPASAPPALPFSYPVAAKVLSPDITHKTDAGGVALEIGTAAELAERARALVAAARTHHSGARIDGVLVQPMERGLAEVLVGYRLDAQAGPVITVGMGGTLAEIYRDYAVRVAPVSTTEAAEMIAEIRGLAVLRGYRGKPPGDVRALAEAIAAISMLADLREPAVLEAEINPLVVKPAGMGVVAVDGVVRLAPQLG